MKVLIADDDGVCRVALTQVLRKFGYEVIAVADGLAAYEHLQQPGAAQVALLDWMMPGLDGLELCRRLKGRSSAGMLYLLLLTSRTTSADMVEGLKAGANDFLFKPFNAAELQARLEVGARLVGLYNQLDQNVQELRTALAERARAETRLRQSEAYLQTVMAAVPAGVLVCDELSGQITDANPVAQASLQLTAEQLRGQPYQRFFSTAQGGALESLPGGSAGTDCKALSARGHSSDVRLSQAAVNFEERALRLLSFVDISDTRRLMAQEQLNLEQARKLLMVANSGVPRWLSLSQELSLHLANYAISSQRAGGDHCWVRTLPAQNGRGPLSVVGLRDQSGHEVNCILRSIATDLFHKEALEQGTGLEEQMAYLNERLLNSGMFAEEDFLTGLTLELEHATLRLRFVSCGHPPLYVLRGSQVLALPLEHAPGRNLPLGSLTGSSFEAGEFQLQVGDRLLLYTDGLLELGKVSGLPLLSVQEFELLLRTLVQQAPELPIRLLIQQLLRAVSGSDGPLTGAPDDVTILGLEIEADAGPHEILLYPPDPAGLDRATKEVQRRLLSDWELQAEQAPRLRLLLDEALTNAWVHGNQRNGSLPIRVNWGKHNAFSLQIEDAGLGFEPGRLADPRSPQRLLSESGRGVFLIQTSCAWAQWKKGGSRLVVRLNGPC